MPSIVVPQGYSYVLAAATSTLYLNIFQMWNVAKARKAAGIPYPYLYAEKSEALSNPAAHKFNCAQRAHQNTLESTAYLITSLLVAGLKHPQLAAALGGAWVAGRFFYTIGYSTGDPAKRQFPGGIMQSIGLLGLIVTSTYTVYEFVKEGL